jgi:leucyl aminopeptidase
MVRFDTIDGRLTAQSADCLIITVFDEAPLSGVAQELDQASGGVIARLKGNGDIPVRVGDTQTLLDVAGVKFKRIVLVGLGKRAELDRRSWRKAAKAALAAASKTRSTEVLFALDRLPAGEMDDYYLGRAVAELTGAVLYRTNDMKSGRKTPPAALRHVRILGVSKASGKAVSHGLHDGQAIAEGQAILRDLGNLPGNICTPRFLATRARDLAKAHKKLSVKILEETQIKRLKMGCLLAVSRGSAEPPRFIVMEYRGGARGSAPVVLVGKGVTFDTGGISLKDPAAMDEMKYDMCGAGSVIATLHVAAKLGLKLNLVGLVPAVENMPGSRATKPGDIVISAAGKTVEILNTDAEGRLILCDALDYARRYKPEVVIDIATLTGACVVALGHHHTAIMGNDDPLARELVDAGVRSDDRGWQLPLTEDYAEQLRSNFADLANVCGRDGGAITAGAFLGRFTKGMRWAHLDIAGTAWLSGAQKGGTGRPVGLLADYLIRHSTRNG